LNIKLTSCFIFQRSDKLGVSTNNSIAAAVLGGGRKVMGGGDHFMRK
jgi:hypothetical protein